MGSNKGNSVKRKLFSLGFKCSAPPENRVAFLASDTPSLIPQDTSFLEMNFPKGVFNRAYEEAHYLDKILYRSSSAHAFQKFEADYGASLDRVADTAEDALRWLDEQHSFKSLALGSSVLNGVARTHSSAENLSDLLLSQASTRATETWDPLAIKAGMLGSLDPSALAASTLDDFNSSSIAAEFFGNPSLAAARSASMLVNDDSIARAASMALNDDSIARAASMALNDDSIARAASMAVNDDSITRAASMALNDDSIARAARMAVNDDSITRAASMALNDDSIARAARMAVNDDSITRAASMALNDDSITRAASMALNDDSITRAASMAVNDDSIARAASMLGNQDSIARATDFAGRLDSISQAASISNHNSFVQGDLNNPYEQLLKQVPKIPELEHREVHAPSRMDWHFDHIREENERKAERQRARDKLQREQVELSAQHLKLNAEQFEENKRVQAQQGRTEKQTFWLTVFVAVITTLGFLVAAIGLFFDTQEVRSLFSSAGDQVSDLAASAVHIFDAFVSSLFENDVDAGLND